MAVIPTLGGEGDRSLSGSDAKERDESKAEGTKALRGVVGKQDDSNDSVCMHVASVNHKFIMSEGPNEPRWQ